MAASANPSPGAHSNGSNGGEKSNGDGEANVINCAGAGAGASATENPAAGPGNKTGLRHNPGVALHWTPHEQLMLEVLLEKYASESSVVRYAIISQEMTDKTVRDVALRCRWILSKKENGMIRKNENSSRRYIYKKDRDANSWLKSSQDANRSNGTPYVPSMVSIGSEDEISFKGIGGVAGQILEQNAKALDQISANFSACKIHENIDLLCQARSNILSILNDSIAMPERIKHMPPLPVKLNEDLAQTILPNTFLPKKILSSLSELAYQEIA